jgi:hypothetical protein
VLDQRRDDRAGGQRHEIDAASATETVAIVVGKPAAAAPDLQRSAALAAEAAVILVLRLAGGTGNHGSPALLSVSYLLGL